MTKQLSMYKKAAMVDLVPLIDKIADGAFLKDLAKETGIDKRRLSEQLRKHPDYNAAKEASIEVQLDNAQEALAIAKENQDITRAREMFRAAAWRAEREFPHRWGKTEQLNVLTGDLTEIIKQARGRIINQDEGEDGECE